MNESGDRGSVNRRGFLKAVTGGVAAAAVSGIMPAVASADEAQTTPAATAQGKAQAKPNILFIIGDQHTHNIMSVAGCDWVKTPNLDRLAAMGTRFTAAHVAYPLSLPCRAAMMTGRPPHQSSPNPTPFTSLGRLMQQAGYATAYYGKWHVGSTNLDRSKDWNGFETTDLCDQLDDKTAAAAVAYLKQKHDRPFFAVASFINPHDCCEYARAQTLDLYKRGGATRPAYTKDLESRVTMRNGQVDVNPPLDKCPPLPKNYQPCSDEAQAVEQMRHPRTDRVFFFHPTETWTDNDWREYRWGYARLVEMVDAQVGKLLTALEESGQIDNTIIVYTSDHGDGTGAHKWNQKWSFYDEPVRVPLIVAWKGKTPAATSDALINTGLDLLPTFCDYAGAAAPKDLLGLSFRPQTSEKGLAAEAKQHEYVVSEMGADDEPAGRMVRSRQYKYIVFKEGANREMLFDMQNDPGEMKNIAADAKHADALAKHRQMLDQWCQATKDTDFAAAT